MSSFGRCSSLLYRTVWVVVAGVSCASERQELGTASPGDTVQHAAASTGAAPSTHGQNEAGPSASVSSSAQDLLDAAVSSVADSAATAEPSPAVSTDATSPPDEDTGTPAIGCGDGTLAADEACDDGNTLDEAACPYGEATCTTCNATCSAVLNLTGPTCGDGAVTDGEACDTAATWCELCRVRPAVAAGGSHTCALLSSGEVRCWGSGAFGQLGNGATDDSDMPVPVSGLSGVIALAAGGSHTCALLSSGEVRCWGQGVFGELGNNDHHNELTPVAVSGLGGVVSAIAAGGEHTCALLISGGVECWGYGGLGQLGDGDEGTQVTPAPVAGLSSGVSAIAAGGEHTCALLTSGGVQCWGAGDYGALGTGAQDNELTPAPVSGLSSGVSAIAAGEFHTCALLISGGAQCFGAGGEGQLGDGATDRQLAPVSVAGLSGVAAMTAGHYHTCALLSSGGVQCWGTGDSGQLGNGASGLQLTPVPVAGLSSGVSAIAAGSEHTCALLDSGGVECWGAGGSGQLGNSSTADFAVPVSVVGIP